MAIKVIGAGFGRTGTGSLRFALERLGFDKCYHMSEIMDHPEKSGDWLKARLKKQIDWDDVFDGYQATADWPSCAFYKELHEYYPEAKVILTVRDPDEWYRSTYETIYAMTKARNKIFAYLFPTARNMKRMITEIIWDGIFYGKFEDEAFAKKVFKDHIEEVKITVPEKQLLIYEIAQGWEPLCNFLSVPVPQGEPFPVINDSKSMNILLLKRILFSMITNLLIFTIVIIALILLFP
jgi:hypothetical protein